MLFAVFSGRFEDLERLIKSIHFRQNMGAPIPIAAAMSGIVASEHARGRSAPEIPRTVSTGNRGCPERLRSGSDSACLRAFSSAARAGLFEPEGFFISAQVREILHLRDHRPAFFMDQPASENS